MARSAEVFWISIWRVRMSPTGATGSAIAGLARELRRRTGPATAFPAISKSHRAGRPVGPAWRFEAASSATILISCQAVAVSCGFSRAPSRSAAACPRRRRGPAPSGPARPPRVQRQRKRRTALVTPSPAKSVHCFTTTSRLGFVPARPPADSIFICNSIWPRPWSSLARITTGTSAPGGAELCAAGWTNSTTGGRSGSTVMRFSRGVGVRAAGVVDQPHAVRAVLQERHRGGQPLAALLHAPGKNLAARLQRARGHRAGKPELRSATVYCGASRSKLRCVVVSGLAAEVCRIAIGDLDALDRPASGRRRSCRSASASRRFPAGSAAAARRTETVAGSGVGCRLVGGHRLAWTGRPSSPRSTRTAA